jgi:hypothetical protein
LAAPAIEQDLTALGLDRGNCGFDPLFGLWGDDGSAVPSVRTHHQSGESTCMSVPSSNPPEIFRAFALSTSSGIHCLAAPTKMAGSKHRRASECMLV